MFLSVNGGMSPGWPATVTFPGLVGCFNWIWDVALLGNSYHPSSRSFFKTSLTRVSLTSLPIYLYSYFMRMSNGIFTLIVDFVLEFIPGLCFRRKNVISVYSIGIL